MDYISTTRARIFVVTVHIKNMIKSGLTEDEYMDPKTVAFHFIDKWEKSGKNRKAAAVVCMSKSGTYHMHMAVIGNTTTLTHVAKTLWDSYTEFLFSDRTRLKEYLLKQNDFTDKGEEILFASGLEILDVHPGKRSDLDEIEDFLNKGYTPDMIYEESLKYRKFESLIKAEYLSRIKKNTPLIKEMINTWHFGSADSGKTYAAYIQNVNKYSESDVYLCVDYNNAGSSGGGLDFYTDNPCKVLVLDELRGNSMSYSRLLSILDCYSRNQTHCRFKNTYNLWTQTEITSIYGPDQIYQLMVDETQQSIDSFKQLLRRLTYITYHWRDGNGNYREYTISAKNFTSSAYMIHQAKQLEPSNNTIIKLFGLENDTYSKAKTI